MENGLPMSTDLESGLRYGRTKILNYLSDLETELGREETYTSHLTGELRIYKVSGYENFQAKLNRIRNHISAYRKRL